MQFKRLLSGFMSAVMALSTVSLPVFGAVYGRVKWTGYENTVRPVNFDIWDGSSYDISWFDKATGTRDDPYIIDSAADLIGISYKTNSPGNKTDGFIDSQQTPKDDVSILKPGEHYALPRNSISHDFTSWYKYTMPAFEITNAKVEPTISLHEIRYYENGYDGDEDHINTGTIACLDELMLYFTIGENTYSASVLKTFIDFTTNTHTYFEYLIAPDFSEDCVFSYDKDNIYRYCETADEMIEELNEGYANSFSFECTAEKSELIFHFDHWYGFTNYGEAYPQVLGELNEFNSPKFPTVTASNSAGDTIIIDETNYTSFYLPETISFTSSLVQTSELPLSDEFAMHMSTTSKADPILAFFGKPTKYTSWKAFSTSYASSVEQYTIATDYYAYYKSVDSTEPDVNYDTKLCAVPLYNTFHYGSGQFRYKTSSKSFDFKVVRTNNMITGNNKTVQFSSPIPTGYDSVTGITLEFTCDDTSGVTITPIFEMKNNDSSDVATIKGTPYIDTYTLSNVIDYNKMISLSDNSSVTYNSSTHTYLGVSEKPATIAKAIIERNIHSRDDLPSYYGTVADDPSFSGKYFRLDADIDISEFDTYYLFPITEKNGSGMAADFDLNGHVIRSKSDLFGTILSDGKLHDGTIVSTGETIVNESLHFSTLLVTAVYENYGTIDNVDIMSNQIFGYGDVDLSSGIRLAATNYGTISNCMGYVGIYDLVSLCYSNYGEIEDCTHMSIASPWSVEQQRYRTHNQAFIVNNEGTIKDFLIDQDVDNMSEGNGNANVYVITSNSGTIDHLMAYDMTIYCGTQYYMIYTNTGVLQNFDISGITFELDTYNGMQAAVCNIQHGVFQDSTIHVKSQSNWAGIVTAMIGGSGTDSPGARGSVHYDLIEPTVRTNSDLVSVEFKSPVVFKSSLNNYNSTVDEHQDFSYLKNKPATQYNCDISIEYIPSNVSNVNSNCIYSGNYINCNLSITGLANHTNSASYGGYWFCGIIVDSNIYLDEIQTLSSYKDGSAFANDIVRSNIHIGKLSKVTDCFAFGEVYFSTITIDEVYDYGGSWPGICKKSYYTDIIINKASGSVTDFLSTHSIDTRYMVTYGGTFNMPSSTKLSGESIIANCEFYYLFNDDAQGDFNTLFAQKNGVVDAFVTNSLIYIGEMPRGVHTIGAGIVSVTAGRSGSALSSNKNVTLIAPRINVAGSATPSNGFSVLANGRSESSKYMSNNAPQNCYADVNLYFENTDSIKYVTGSQPMLSGDAGYVINNNTFNINVYDMSGAALDMPVYALASYHPQTIRINNIILRSNTLSTKSAIFYLESGSSFPALLSCAGGSNMLILRNSVLDLVNAPDYEPGVTNSGEYPGFVYSNNWMDGTESDDSGVLIGIMQKLNVIGVLHCFVPEGKSCAYTNFSSDPLLNTFEALDAWMAQGGASNNLDYQTAKILAEEMDLSLNSEDDSVAQDVQYYNADGDTSGELAYLLDRGGTRRRTYDWSVADETCFLINSLTNEQIYDFPDTTLSSRLHIPERCLGGETNLNPVFKATIKASERGYVELEGIGKTHTDTLSDDFIYAKQHSYIVSDEVITDESSILVYATQQLGTAYPVRIPSTPRDGATTNGYTITGYKQQGIDTIITPVFKTARNITVNVTGSQNGTIVPSAYVSAEGEKITLTLNVSNGYMISNVKVNGLPLSEAFFYMPDEDVEITGDCVPFEGGITAFSLFGFAGEIDQIAKTINVVVPRTAYITNALPDIEYVGDFITPSENVHVDFTNPVEYTVTYGDNQTVTYLVTVEQSEYTMRIYDYVVNGIHADINQARRTINLKLPANTDLRHITPEYIVYSAESISPSEDTELDFLTSQIYTLYATRIPSTSYVVTITIADEDEAEINTFKVSGYEGTINQDENLITLNVPKGINFTDIMPDIITYTGKTLEMNKAEKNDLSSETTYTVTSQNDTPRVYTVLTNYISDNEAHIDTFVLAGVNGEIDQDAETIHVVVPKGTILTGVAPDELTYTGKSIYPRVDAEQDFSSPVKYTVVAPDNSEKTYTVTVEYAKNNEAILYEFDILGYVGEVNQEDKTVTVDIPYGIDISDTPPSNVVISEGATINPTEEVKQDFTTPKVYRVTSEDGKAYNDYTVTCIVAPPNSDANITYFEILGTPGIIDQNKKTITTDLPSSITENDLVDVVPTITWKGKTINPGESEPQDFNNASDYTVTAEDPSIQVTYDIIVNLTKSTDAIITYFEILDTPGVIDQVNKTITVELPPDTTPEKLKDIVPSIIWKGKTITPDEDDSQDFNNPPDYTVTAVDPTIQTTYDIIIKIKSTPPINKDSTAIINYFEILNTPGVIDQDKSIITVTLSSKIKPDDLKDIVPVIKWQGETINPNENDKQDFNNPPDYTVTAEDPTFKKTYDVDIKILDGTAEITYFEILGTPGDIDPDSKTITVILPPNTDPDDLKDIIPTIKWKGKDIDPDDNTSHDFNNPPDYTVTAEDPDVKNTYDVIVKIKDRDLDKTAIITYFEILNTPGEIDQENKTITVTLPKDLDLSMLQNIIPVIKWQGKAIDPGEFEPNDFGLPTVYTVYAEDPSVEVPYTVIIDLSFIIPPSDRIAIITYFEILGVPGVIDQDKKTITVTMPRDTDINTLRNVVPIIKWQGKELTPNENMPNDFDLPTVYTVIANNPFIQVPYTVTVDLSFGINPDTGVVENINKMMLSIVSAGAVLTMYVTRKRKKDDNEDDDDV